MSGSGKHLEVDASPLAGLVIAQHTVEGNGVEEAEAVLSPDIRDFSINTKAFSGDGGLHASGRWLHAGVHVIFAASSLSLAALACERVDGHEVAVSSPEKVFFADGGHTKLDLARYYESVGEWILPHLRDRPLSLVRCPRGPARCACSIRAGCPAFTARMATPG